MVSFNNALQQIKTSLSLTQLLAASIQGGVMWLVARLVLLGLGIKPPHEWLFLSSLLIAGFLLVLVISTILGHERRPCFIGEFAAVTIGEMEAVVAPAKSMTPEKFTFVSPILDISNTGAPSIAKGYRLTVIFNDGTVKTGEPFSVQSAGPVFFTHSSGTAEVYNSDDLLVRKSLFPIPRGGLIQCRLLYRFLNISVSDLRTIGTKLRIEFQDLWGETYTTEFKYTEHSDTILHFAGMNSPHVAIAQPELNLPVPPATQPLLTPNTEASPHSPTS